jgi:hypothetical protein
MLTPLKTHVFRPLKVLHQTQTIRLLVAPHTLEARAIPEWAERVLPVPPCVVSGTLKHVTTREAQNTLLSKF